MFSNRWFARAPASHWLSPSVSMPTSRFMRRRASSILVRVAERDVPVVRVLVKGGIDVDGVHLCHELHRGFHLEVAGALEQAPEARVHGEGADLVRIGLPRLAIDPVE